MNPALTHRPSSSYRTYHIIPLKWVSATLNKLKHDLNRNCKPGPRPGILWQIITFFDFTHALSWIFIAIQLLLSRYHESFGPSSHPNVLSEIENFSDSKLQGFTPPHRYNRSFHTTLWFIIVHLKLAKWKDSLFYI